MKNFTIVTFFAGLLFSNVTVANTIILPSMFETNLIGVGGILDSAFGLENVQRVDDELDQYWNATGSEVSVTAVAKHAGFSQVFGFIDDNDDFTSVLDVPYMASQTGSFSAAAAGSNFRFGLDPSGSPLFSSDPNDNTFCGWFHCYGPYDHMVSWLITDGEYAGDYIVAWEDLKKLGDRDYNDLVIRVSGATVVPVPAAFWLFASGIFGLVAVTRKARH